MWQVLWIGAKHQTVKQSDSWSVLLQLLVVIHLFCLFHAAQSKDSTRKRERSMPNQKKLNLCQIFHLWFIGIIGWQNLTRDFWIWRSRLTTSIGFRRRNGQAPWFSIVWRGRSGWWWDGCARCRWRIENAVWICTVFWVYSVADVVRHGKLRWFGHLERGWFGVGL